MQVGDAEECAPGPPVAGAAGEETSQLTAPCQLPTIPHHGNKSKGSSELTSSWTHLCVRATSWYSSKPAPNFQYCE
jgi:hypothetical protein